MSRRECAGSHAWRVLLALALAGGSVACVKNDGATSATVAARASTPNVDRARELNEAGVTAYAANHIRDAIQYFRESWRLGGDSLVLWNEARCHELLDEAELAADAVEVYMKQPGIKPEERAEAQRKLAALKGRPSRLTIVTSPAGATFTIDGHPAAGLATPVSTAIPAGTHTIVVGSKGYDSESRDVDARFGRAVILELELVKRGP